MVRELVTMMSPGAQTTVEIASDRFGGARPQSYTVVRARFDQWLADRVTEKGVMVVPKMKVDELLVEPAPEARRPSGGSGRRPVRRSRRRRRRRRGRPR